MHNGYGDLYPNVQLFINNYPLGLKSILKKYSTENSPEENDLFDVLTRSALYSLHVYCKASSLKVGLVLKMQVYCDYIVNKYYRSK